jgi:hypothetical protein
VLPTTTPATIGTLEAATNKENLDYLAFIDTADRVAGFSMKMPDAWDRGNLRIRFYWMVTAAPTSGTTVQFGIKAVARGDNEAIDLAWGSEAVVSDTYQTANYLHITDATTLTCGGSPALLDIITFSVRRDTANDDAAATALLLGIGIQFYNTNNPTIW